MTWNLSWTLQNICKFIWHRHFSANLNPFPLLLFPLCFISVFRHVVWYEKKARILWAIYGFTHTLIWLSCPLQSSMVRGWLRFIGWYPKSNKILTLRTSLFRGIGKKEMALLKDGGQKEKRGCTKKAITLQKDFKALLGWLLKHEGSRGNCDPWEMFRIDRSFNVMFHSKTWQNFFWSNFSPRYLHCW